MFLIYNIINGLKLGIKSVPDGICIKNHDQNYSVTKQLRGKIYSSNQNQSIRDWSKSTVGGGGGVGGGPEHFKMWWLENT